MGKLIAMSKLTGDPQAILNEVLEQERRMPDEPMVKVLKGWAYSKIGDFPKASQAFDRAIELNPQSFWAYFRKGQMLAKRDKYREALACFNVAVRLRPKKVDFWLEKAFTEDELGMITVAYHSYDKATQLGDKTGWAWFGKARILAFLNRFDDALEAVRAGIKMDPEEPAFKDVEEYVLDKLRGY